MELKAILPFLAVLACPVCMGLMMWLMNKNKGSEQSHSAAIEETPVSPAERLAALCVQQQALEAEIAEATRLAEVEARQANPLSVT
jgi:hypothetical protein